MSEYGELVDRYIGAPENGCLCDLCRLKRSAMTALSEQAATIASLKTQWENSVDRANATIAELRDLLSQTKDALNGSRTSLEAAEADARRYRWLRGQPSSEVLAKAVQGWSYSAPMLETLDAAIDAAIAKGAP